MTLLEEVREVPQLMSLLRNTRLSADELAAVQERKLRALIRHAYYHVPYYRSLFDSVGLRAEDVRTLDDLKHVPVTTKQALRVAGTAKSLASGIFPDSCLRYYSSGTSGEPFAIYLSPSELRQRALVEFRAHLSVGFRPLDRLGFLGGEKLRSPQRPHERIGLFRSWNVPAVLPIDEQVRRLHEIRPTILWAYPTLLRAALQRVDYRLSAIARPRVLITSAEVFDESLRRHIEADVPETEMFQFYGCIEIGRIAVECPTHEGLHVISDQVIFECIEGDRPAASGATGTVLVTSLSHYAMPFIRYRLGDIVRPLGKRCSCGSSYPLIAPPLGREWDMIVLPSGRLVSPLALHYPLRSMEWIEQFRLTQDAADRVVLQLAVWEHPTREMLADLRGRLLALLQEPIGLEIDIKESLSPDGLKFRAFVSRLRAADARPVHGDGGVA